MRVRVTSAFVTRFDEALRDLQECMPREIAYCSDCDEEWPAGQKKCQCGGEDVCTVTQRSIVPWHLAVEEFLTTLAPDLARVLKHQLLDALLADVAAAQVPVPEAHSATGTDIPLDSPAAT